MPSWFRAGRKSQDIVADESVIRVYLVSRDPALIQEVHKDLFVGFWTRGSYEFQSDHPDFQQRSCCSWTCARPCGVLNTAGYAGVGVKNRIEVETTVEVNFLLMRTPPP